MDQQNPYATPNSDLTPRSQGGEKPTIEEALARGYDFEIGEVISEAWQKTEGFKLPVLIAYIILIACSIPMMLLLFIPFVGGIIYSGLISVLVAGVYGMTLCHYRGQSFETKDIFKYIKLFSPILLVSVMSYLLTVLGMILLVIPGVYLSVAYALGVWILIENQELSFWEAMEASRKAITQHWFKFFFLCLALGVIIMISAIPFGIGLFWTMPLSLLSVAIVYERIFGVR